jgi:hypothetical protein
MNSTVRHYGLTGRLSFLQKGSINRLENRTLQDSHVQAISWWRKTTNPATYFKFSLFGVNFAETSRTVRVRRNRRRELIGAPPQKKFRNFINQLIFVALIRPIDFRSWKRRLSIVACIFSVTYLENDVNETGNWHWHYVTHIRIFIYMIITL